MKLVKDEVVCPMCVETLATSDIKVLTPSMLRTGNEEVEEKVDEEDARPVTGSSRINMKRFVLITIIVMYKY